MKSKLIATSCTVAFGLGACGSSGFEGKATINVNDAVGGLIKSTDGKTCTYSKFSSDSVVLSDNSGKVLALGTLGAGTVGPSLTLPGRGNVYVSCKNMPVTFNNVPSTDGPYAIAINNGSKTYVTEDQLKNGDVNITLQ